MPKPKILIPFSPLRGVPAYRFFILKKGGYFYFKKGYIRGRHRHPLWEGVKPPLLKWGGTSYKEI
jgi:hypothetical protein